LATGTLPGSSNADARSAPRRRAELALTAINQPVSWWGWHGYSQPQPLSIAQVLAAGNLSAEMAALLWIGLREGASIVVASDPPSSGKTTTLSALLPFFPQNALLYFTRGLGEKFDLPPLAGQPVYLMVNEISDHLPVYSWGANVQRIFELMNEGYAMASTMHCDTTEEVIEQLRDDVGVDQSLIAALTFVLPIDVRWQGGSVRRRSLELALLDKGQDGAPAKTALAEWSAKRGSYLPPNHAGLERFAARFGGTAESVSTEMERRATLLRDLSEQRFPADQLEDAIAAYEAGAIE
jgi:hypothetical protein